MAPPIRTPRLVLRDHVREDWDAIHRFATDPEVVRYMEWGPNTPAETTRFLDLVLASTAEDPRRSHNRAVTLAADGRLVGNCVLHVHDPAQETAFIGYMLDRAVWGQGIGTEVAVGLLGFGFGELGLRRIVASCDARNLASARVLEKAGLRHEGHLRQERRQKGEWRDTLLLALLRDEWRPPGSSDGAETESAG